MRPRRPAHPIGERPWAGPQGRCREVRPTAPSARLRVRTPPERPARVACSGGDASAGIAVRLAADVRRRVYRTARSCTRTVLVQYSTCGQNSCGAVGAAGMRRLGPALALPAAGGREASDASVMCRWRRRPGAAQPISTGREALPARPVGDTGVVTPPRRAPGVRRAHHRGGDACDPRDVSDSARAWVAPTARRAEAPSANRKREVPRGIVMDRAAPADPVCVGRASCSAALDEHGVYGSIVPVACGARRPSAACWVVVRSLG